MSVRRPSTDQLNTALDAARRMHAQGVDPHNLALSLEFLHARCEQLEALYQVLDRYLRFGMAEHELSGLHRMVRQLREADLAAERERGADNPLPL